MLKFSDIKILQLEVSNYCNASCPQCPRNFFGGKTIPTLPLKSWTLTEFKKIFDVKLLQQLNQVYFCGTYGDPLTNLHIVDMCKFIKDSNPKIEVGIHTNGGVGGVDRFTQLAKVTDFIAFGIDGLEDTNHLYRRNVKWNKIIENATAYIQNGGKALWDYIVFKHNEHQVELARKLSLDLGFANFSVKYTGRFLDRKHMYNNSLLVYNNDGFIDYSIMIPTKQEYINKNYQTVNFINNNHGSLTDYAASTCISCNSKRISEVYIGADGFVFPCGWLHDRLYGPEVETHPDHVKIKKLLSQAGGITKTNIFYSSLEDIIDGGWFDFIEKSWSDPEFRLERCGIMCGDTLNLIGCQNTEIEYKK